MSFRAEGTEAESALFAGAHTPSGPDRRVSLELQLITAGWILSLSGVSWSSSKSQTSAMELKISRRWICCFRHAVCTTNLTRHRR